MKENLFDTNPRALKVLLQEIHNREAVLPSFQREFVWEPTATQELIASIASNYPAGSLLRILNTNNLFECREFEGARPLGGAQSTYLVLDGQQRLTSLYQALYGIGDHRYYLDLRKLLETDEFEECVFYRRASHSNAKQYAQEEVQARDLILPLSVLKGGVGDFGRWTRMVARKIISPSDRIAFEDKMSVIEDDWIRIID